MKLIKLSQFKKETNHIANYFVLDFGNNPQVYKFPFFVTSETFRKQLNEQNSKKGIPDFRGNITHACYDVSSNKLYFPEVSSTEELSAIEKSPIVPALEITLLKIYKTTSSGGKIAGNPQIFRIRKVGNFFSATNFIKKNIISNKVPFNPELLVIEADLSSMPKTVEFLKIEQNQESLFVSQNRGVVPFIRNTGVKDYLLYTLKGPFILINLSSIKLKSGMEQRENISETEKDRIVVMDYKKYVEEQISADETEMIDELKIFNIKYFISLGEPLQKICNYLINTTTTKNIETLLTEIGPYIIVACRELEKEGYKNPLRNYYYYIIKRSKNFPIGIPISPEIKAFNTDNQHPCLQVLSYDPQEDLITLRSKLYISEDVCKQIFFTDDVTILSYLADDKKFRSVKNVMSEKKVGNSVKLVVNNIKKDKGFDEKEKFAFEQITNASKFSFEKRKVSDFYQAADKIKEIIKKINAVKNTDVKFDDLDVLIGPLQLLQRGAAGGYAMSKDPEIKYMDFLPGLKVNFPYIIIDTVSRPTISEAYDALMHEYTHHINEALKIKSPEYNIQSVAQGDKKALQTYYNSPNEREAHIQQSMYLLSLGMSKDQVLYKHLGKEVADFNNLYLAKIYSDFIEEAAKRLEKASETEGKEEVAKSTIQEFEGKSKTEKMQKMREELMGKDNV